MIQSIFIENFKGFKTLEIEELKRLTLLSGRNNVGKSSLLEAIFLFLDHASYDSFLKLNGFRGNSIGAQTGIWESVFYNMDTAAPLCITVENDGQKACLRYEKELDVRPYSTNDIPDSVVAQFSAAGKNNYSLGFSYSCEQYAEEGHFFADGARVLRQLKTNLPGNEIRPMNLVRYINAIYAREFAFVIDGIGKLELAGEKDSIVQILRELDPNIEDIVTLSIQGQTQLYVRMGNKLLPLQNAGDGVVKLLNLCLAVRDVQNGILLVDELETGLHYSMYEKLWKVLDEISKKYNCQIIATTHSYEVIAAARMLQSADDFAYYRLGRNKDGIFAYRYNHMLLGDALSSELEVR